MGHLLHSGKAYEQHMVQVQGQLLICADRDWTDVTSYHPEMPPALIRIERDPKFIALLDEAVSEFSADLENTWGRECSSLESVRALALQAPDTQASLIRDLKASLVKIKEGKS